MRNVYLFQPQYAVEYRKETSYWLPYSAGCLWSYCNQFAFIKSNFHLADLFFRRENQEDLVNKLIDPAVCGFSCYQWNRNYCINLAEKIKKRWPNVVIIFGGPEVTIEFSQMPFVDCVVFGEGEQAWLDILQNIINCTEFKSIYPKTRLTIDDFPSPYTSGVFDNIIKNNPDVLWAVTLETNRGCPFSCTFCDWGSVTYSKIKKLNLSRVKEDINWIADNPVAYIFCADANFGIMKDRDLEIARLVAAAGKRSQHLEIFNATYNKNNNDWSFKILKELGSLNKGFTVSVQSLNAQTLKAVKRDNLGINDLQKIFAICNRESISCYTELILGLPYETKDSFICGLCELLELGQHNQIDVWFTDLITNSELASGMSKINYGIQTVATKNYLALFNQNDDSGYDEHIDLICSTKTMSRDDMIESYLYAWMIVNVHLQGYSQLVSKYCRFKYGISYKIFYDKLLTLIKQDNIIGKIYDCVKKTVTGLLVNGHLPPGVSAHNLVFFEGSKLYLEKEALFDIIGLAADEFCTEDNEGIKKLQQYFIFDPSIKYPISVQCDFDFDTLECKDSNLSIYPRSKFEFNDFSDFYYALRRSGLIKNKIDTR